MTIDPLRTNLPDSIPRRERLASLAALGGSGDHARRGRRTVVALVLVAAVFSSCNAGARDAVLTWTSPGDDGMVGQCDSVVVGMKTVAVAGTDTLGWWANAARYVKRNPRPAGQADTLVVPGLRDDLTYRFIAVAYAAADSALYERSFFSNVATLSPRDLTRPATIGGLRVVDR